MASSKRAQSRYQSGRMAFCGLMVGLSAALMLAGGWIPIATYCAPLYGGILLLPVLIEHGKKSAWTAFAAAALLSLFLCGDKEAAFFYLFIGYYPIVKSRFDSIRRRPVRIAAKLVFFNVSLVGMYALLSALLGLEVLRDFEEMGAVLLAFFAVAMNACMLLYDRLLVSMSLLYVRRLRPKFRFLRR